MERLQADFGPLREELSGPQGVAAMVENGWKTMRPDMDTIERDFGDLRNRIDKDTQPRLLALADRGQAEWTRTQAIWTRLVAAGGDAVDSYGSLMADSSLMAGQLSHAMDDGIALLVKLLLGKPGEDGMTRLKRFEAASRLAVALGDLRTANDALQSLADGTESVDPAMATRLRRAAARAVERFRTSIDRLNQLWQQPVR